MVPAAGVTARRVPPTGSSEPGTVARFVYAPKNANAAIAAITNRPISAATTWPIGCARRIAPSHWVDCASSAS